MYIFLITYCGLISVQPNIQELRLDNIHMEGTITKQILRRTFLKFSESSIWKERLPSKPQSQLPENSRVIDMEGRTTKQTPAVTRISHHKTAMETLTSKPASVEDFKAQPSLWYKIHVFVFDLRNFQENSQAQERLNCVQDLSYIGAPYFDPVEAQQLKAYVMDGTDNKPLEILIKDTLKERLERRMKKRADTGDYRVCAAHDIAPIFEKAFDIKPKDLQTNTEFLALLDRSQLKLGDSDHWKGLPKKSFQPRNQRKKR